MDVRGDQPFKVTSTVFYRSSTTGFRYTDNTVETASDLSQDFHTFRLTWKADLLVCAVDDVEVTR